MRLAPGDVVEHIKLDYGRMTIQEVKWVRSKREGRRADGTVVELIETINVCQCVYGSGTRRNPVLQTDPFLMHELKPVPKQDLREAA